VLILEILYAISAALLAMYGFNNLILTAIRQWRFASRESTPSPGGGASPEPGWPLVTVQLPIYNERYVVERLIQAVARLDYPRDRLQVQVLDDSTDDTQHIVARAIAHHRAAGLDMEHVRRPERSGYKGGALQHGLATARGEYIAIFDADFLPPPDFLADTIPHFSDPAVGCLQTRWGHVNPESSWLTRAQAVGIDGHFVVEQAVRSETAAFLNFNGTAGVWRRECINDAGGWQSDTLTEDLDLSYRAQLRGWRIRFLPQVVVPAELPVQVGALKRQQFRWAKGSIQTAVKLLRDLWRSSRSLIVKIEATIHLTNYAVHPMMLLNLLLTLPLAASGSPLLRLVPVFTMAAIGPPLMYWVAMGEGDGTLRKRLSHLPVLVFLGTGLSVNNTRAVAEALLGVRSAFLRTPKFNLRGQDRAWRSNPYALPRDPTTWIEMALAGYAIALLAYVLLTGVWGLVPWLLIYAGGYSYIAGLSFIQAWQRALAAHASPGPPVAG